MVLTSSADYVQVSRNHVILLPSEVGLDLPKKNLRSDLHIGYDAMVRWADNINDFNYSVGANLLILVSMIGNNMMIVAVTLGIDIVIVFGIVIYINWGYAVGRF